MRRVFFIVGPTAAGKSEIAAEVAEACGAEIVNADAFQIYRGLNLLTAKPDAETLRKAPHHLIGAVALSEEMNAEKFRVTAQRAIQEIQGRGKPVIVAGGSGLYVKALTHGLAPLPKTDHALRAKLNGLSLGELSARLESVDPEAVQSIDRKNKRRLVRALEICLLTKRPVSEQRTQSAAVTAAVTSGVFVFRDREELYDRINRRVEAMFAHGVVEEIRVLGEVGPTAHQTLGLRQIRELIAGKILERECIAAIQQATRRYAKRQLTWFQRQTNLEPLNPSLHRPQEAIEWISQKARLSFAHV